MTSGRALRRGKYLRKAIIGCVSSYPAIISHAVNLQTAVREVSVAEFGRRVRWRGLIA